MVLCMNVSAGIGVIGMASPMLQEVFGGQLIGQHLKFGELDQSLSIGDAAIARGGAEDRRQIVIFAFMPAARTEQLGMGGGSIKAPVQGRDPRR